MKGFTPEWYAKLPQNMRKDSDSPTRQRRENRSPDIVSRSLSANKDDWSPGRVQIVRVADIGPSLNVYDRMHFTKRDRLVKQWHKMVEEAVEEQDILPVESYPVHVEIECYFGKGRTRFDWDNLSPTPKLIQDALVSCGVLANDTSKYIKRGSMEAFKTPHEESYTVFRIVEAAA